MPTPAVTETEQAPITCQLERKMKRGLQVVGGVFDYGRMLCVVSEVDEGRSLGLSPSLADLSPERTSCIGVRD